MIGIWLFATICVPFVEVLLSTWIQALKEERTEEAQQDPLFKKISQPTRRDIFDSKVKQKVGPMESSLNPYFVLPENSRLLSRLELCSKYIMPGAFVAFVVIYWFIGLVTYWT